MDSEEWTTIKGHHYFISTHGNVENARTGKLLTPRLSKTGYHTINLYINGKAKDFKVHKLVANAFIDNPHNKQFVDHIDGDKLNNRIDNLRYVTKSQNAMNLSMHVDNTSGAKGVTYHKKSKKWMARIMINGKQINIGLYKTIEEATQARKQYANQLFGEFTHQSEKL